MPLDLPSDPTSPFHAGEQAIQQRLGVRQRVEQLGRRVIRDHMPAQHREFFARLAFLLLGARDSEGRPWATILSGRPGFLSAPDPHSLHVAGRPLPGDPLAEALRPGAPLGLLGIELETRRRNRLNGRVSTLGPDGFTLAVDQSFGNCPQYIQRREPVFRDAPDGQGQPTREDLSSLDPAARTAIAAADTFFIATAGGGEAAAGGADVSHRGGRPGFVWVEDGRRLSFPDYAGNLHFNTLGNLLLDPRAGLLFVDFARGDLLYLTGTVEIVWEGAEVAAFAGAERILRFTLSHGRRLRDALPLRWRLRDYAPDSLATGTWAEAETRLQAERRRDLYRPYRITRIESESTLIRSFHLTPADGGGLPPLVAGQHLPIRLELPGRSAPVRRTYTISSAPGEAALRISVKREPNGLASTHLHAALALGDTIEALAPRGDFTLDAAPTRPAVLIGAGVGVTPMLAMLRHLVAEGARGRRVRPLWFVHVARDGRQRAFFAEVRRLAASSEAVRTHFVLTAPRPEDKAGRDFDSRGRLDAGRLRRLLPLNEADIYLCGPSGFMQATYDALRDLGVADARIFAEAFGPAALRRRGDAAAIRSPALPQDAADKASVRFAASETEAAWTPARGTLLELAEAEGLSPDFGCRQGSCGSCAVALRAGAVTYRQAPTAPVPPGEVLLCCAVPKAGAGGAVVLDL